jgi:hypothetical protein
MAGRCAGKVGDLSSFSRLGDTLAHGVVSTGGMRAAAQYAVRQRILDLCTFDITVREILGDVARLFDAIIADPPCKPLISSPEAK